MNGLALKNDVVKSDTARCPLGQCVGKYSGVCHHPKVQALTDERFWWGPFPVQSLVGGGTLHGERPFHKDSLNGC